MVQGLTNKDTEERAKDRKGNSKKRIVINRTYLKNVQKNRLIVLDNPHDFASDQNLYLTPWEVWVKSLLCRSIFNIPRIIP